jgi:RNA-directed DNA polymerase
MVDAEVRAFLDRLEHALGCEGRRHRVTDGTLRRVLRKGRRAGVPEGETLSSPERGRPPGGVGSPMLAHTVLAHTLDDWGARAVKPRRQGRCCLRRGADEFVSGGEREAEARRMLGVVPRRCARVQRTIPPQKPRLVRCQPPRHEDAGERGDGTFGVLALPHYWATSRRGDGVITRRTAEKRRRLAMRAGWQWGRPHRHDPRRDQDRVRCQERRGHSQGYGMRGNDRQLAAR